MAPAISGIRPARYLPAVLGRPATTRSAGVSAADFGVLLAVGLAALAPRLPTSAGLI
jgi:hypothetical protein